MGVLIRVSLVVDRKACFAEFLIRIVSTSFVFIIVITLFFTGTNPSEAEIPPGYSGDFRFYPY
jgi:hypothetical protein